MDTRRFKISLLVKRLAALWEKSLSAYLIVIKWGYNTYFRFSCTQILDSTYFFQHLMHLVSDLFAYLPPLMSGRFTLQLITTHQSFLAVFASVIDRATFFSEKICMIPKIPLLLQSHDTIGHRWSVDSDWNPSMGFVCYICYKEWKNGCNLVIQTTVLHPVRVPTAWLDSCSRWFSKECLGLRFIQIVYYCHINYQVYYREEVSSCKWDNAKHNSDEGQSARSSFMYIRERDN